MNNQKSGTVFGIFVFIIVILTGILIYSLNSKPKVLVVSGHPEWAPIMWQSGNKIIGAGPDLMEKICVDLKIVCDVKATGIWDEVQEKTKSGETDILVAAYKTDARMEYMNYSDPYTTDPISVFVKNGSNFNYTKWDDLIGKKGVLTTGDSYGQEFDSFIKDKLTTTRVDTAKEAFDKVTSGNADYLIYALYSGKSEIKKENLTDKIVALPKKVTEENFYITISKKSPFVKLMPKINELIEKYKSDGTIDKMISSNEELSGLNK